MNNAFVFVIFDETDRDSNGCVIKRFRGVFDNLNHARKAMERPIFKNFKWIDETHYEYDGILVHHYGVITSVPKNELIYI